MANDKTLKEYGHDADGGHGEPQDGWVTAPTLVDTEILTLALCRYTGHAPDVNGRCHQRALRLHADVECTTLYHQAEALRSGRVHYDLPAAEVTVPVAGDEPTYRDPLA